MDLSDTLEIYALTSRGLRRERNEDYIGHLAYAGVAVLADGMGGYNAGDVASSVAVNSILSNLPGSLYNRAQLAELTEFNSTEAAWCYRAAIRANQSVYQVSQSQPHYTGMGTTLVTALFYNNQVTVAHVGDSRFYRLDGEEGTLTQITRDHTVLQELIDRGVYTPEEALASSNKNLVTRALGVDKKISIDITDTLVNPNDIFLLCSDGLHDLVSEEAIELTVSTFKDHLDAAATSLIQQANDAGGHDNTSVILIKCHKPFPEKTSWFQQFSHWFKR